MSIQTDTIRVLLNEIDNTAKPLIPSKKAVVRIIKTGGLYRLEVSVYGSKEGLSETFYRLRSLNEVKVLKDGQEI